MQRGFAVVYLILALAVMVAIGVGAYYLGQSNSQLLPPPISTPPLPPLEKNLPIINKTPDQTANLDLIGANWKTYTNTKFHFQLKYPNTWFTNDCGDSELGLLLDPVNPPVCDNGPVGPKKGIELSVTTDSKTIADYIKSLESVNYKTTVHNSHLPNNAVKYLIESIKPGYAPGPDKAIVIIVPLKNATLGITANELQYEPVIDQILSTFKFTSS